MKKNTFPINKINTVKLGDSIEELKLIPDNSVDLIFADPPYNMQLDGILKRVDGSEFKGVEGSKWDEFESIEDYKKFTYEWLKEAKRILKKNKSSLWVIGSFQNIYLVGNILQELGFWIINDVIWSKTNPTPNFMGTKFTNKQETLLWATPSKKTKYTFNYKTMKELNGGKQMTSIWEIPVSTGNERLKDNNGEKLHPTQKPEKLLYNIIISSTQKGDLILDPFSGTGTTAALAKRLGRKYFAIEKDTKYYKYSVERINLEIEKSDDYINAKFDIKPPIVKFKELVEKQYIFNNEKVYFKKTELYANISEEKELYYEGKHYGISKLGGILSGIESNVNGWEVWYVERNGEKVSISDIRDEYRDKELNFK
ncbi:site-specific DNA-methyltransferase [Streptobacillus felis]|uniref:DNA-methyltransferase n=1 Tax=Streptobacillus felis TaxID=1384509 RepID=UPI0008377421|nr:site-specific DNA-methyltransferase [Streptobacillus felis]